MPDIYIMDGAIANAIFLYLFGAAALYGLVCLIPSRRKK